MRKKALCKKSLLFTCLLAVSVLCGPAAGDWPTYRADNQRTGAAGETVKPPLSLQWTFKPAHAPKPAWPEPAEELPRAHCDNAHHVVAADGVAYFGSSVDDAVYAIDVEAGKIRWRFFAEGPVRFAPTVSGGRVYFGSDDGNVYCLGAADGRLIWKHRVGPTGRKAIGNGRVISSWPVRTSVVVDEGEVLATAGVFPYEGIYVCALEAEDGSVIWKNGTVGARAHELPFGGISPHGYLVASKSALYVPSGRAAPGVFDRKTGELRFCMPTRGKRGGVWALLDQGRLLTGVDASGRHDKIAYDAEKGGYLGDAFTWAPGGVDIVVAPDFSHVLKRDGIHTIDRKLYDDTRRKIAEAEESLKEVQAGLHSALLAIGCPEDVPAPDVHLSDLEALEATCGWSKPGKDKSVSGKALSVAGRKYARGMGVHADSQLVYPLKADYKAFVAVVGIDDAVAARGSAAFQVSVDGRVLTETPTIRGDGNDWRIYVPVPAGGRQIRLTVSDGGDGTGWDHADWVNAGFVTRAVKAPQMPKKPSAELEAKIASLRSRRDAARTAIEEAGNVRSVRRYPRAGLISVIRAGELIIAGGDGVVLALDSATHDQRWQADVQGRAVALAASGGRLFVSTEDGLVHCFGPEAPAEAAVIPPFAAGEPAEGAKDDLTVAYEQAAERIVEKTGVTKGWCVVRDFGAGTLAVELAKRTELKIIGLEKDPEKLAAARRNIEAAGLLGRRVAVEPWEPADLPPYFANLIVSDEKLFSRKSEDFADEFARLLRPWGGTAVFCSRGGDEIVLAKIVRGRLDGAGSWTSQHGNARNTACSQDTLVKSPFSVLWYGEPGPKRMVERHARAASPVAMNGRLFIGNENGVAAYDAYNGTLLWQRDIPGCVRVRADVDGGNLALTDEALYVAARDKCYRLDPATGGIARVYTMPRSSDGTPRRWGYVAAVGNILFGTTATPFANEYAQLVQSLIDPVTGEWKDEEAVPAELRDALRSFKAGSPKPDENLHRELQRRGGYWRRMGRFPSWRKEVAPGVARTESLTFGDALFAVDADTGEVLWVHRAKGIPNISVAVADGVVYFVQSATEAEHRAAARDKQTLIEEGVYDEGPQAAGGGADARVVVAAKASTGEIIWKRPLDVTGCGGDKMGLAVKDGVLLLLGHFSNHDTGAFLHGQLRWRRITALDAADGKVIWSRPLNYLRRPLVVGDRIIIEPRACELRTGRIVTRPHPVTGRAVPWEFLRPGHSCGVTSASAGALFYRSFCAAIYGLEGDRGLDLFGAIRPGCWINVIPANGLVLMPEASSGCTCSYPIRCSVAMVSDPRRGPHDGTVFITHGPATPVRRLAVNFGATGDIRDKDGALWIAYPRPKAVSGVGYGPYGMDLDLNCETADGMGFFRRDFRAAKVAGSHRPWLFASGCRGLLRCELPLIDEAMGEKPGRYSVRLGFAAPAGDKPGGRVFDVKLQGRTVLNDFDVIKEAGSADAAVVRKFDGVQVARSLVIEFVPRAAEPTEGQAPLINFIELVRQDPMGAPEPVSPVDAAAAAKLLETADAERAKGNTDKAVDLYHRIFRGAEDKNLRISALEGMTALAAPESLACIRECWDGSITPILSGYIGPDPEIVDGMVRLRLAIADKLAAREGDRAAAIVTGSEGILSKMGDRELRLRLVRRLGDVIDWRLLGPIPWGENTTLAAAYEAGKPVSAEKPHKLNGRLLEWRAYAAESKSIDLRRAIGRKEWVYAYAWAKIVLDKPCDLRLKIGADDAFKCWFNGKLAGGTRDLTTRRGSLETLQVKGRKGVNTILLQVINCDGGWGFSVRVRDSRDRPVASLGS